MHKYKYNELYGKICAKFGSISSFASELKKTPDTISAKLHGKRPWKNSEINQTCILLGIEHKDIPIYFFN